MTITTIILIVLALVVLWTIFSYNGFVTLTNRAKEAWADIQVQLKRRYDLIPNLVDTVKGYASHERATFDAVTEARTKATQIHIDPTNITPAQITAMAGAEDALSQTLGKLLAIAEAYPDLKANQNFLQLQKELGDTEDKIQASRRFYNTSVMALNTAEQSFPGNIIASTFSSKPMDLFELATADAAAAEPVKVQF